jgi:hypothetical protein
MCVGFQQRMGEAALNEADTHRTLITTKIQAVELREVGQGANLLILH